MLLVQLGAVVALLSGISTVLASYLAEVGGSGGPELLSIRTRESSSFFRDVHTFIVDDGSFLSFDALAGDLFSNRFLNSFVRTRGTSLEKMGKIMTYRERFENIIKTEGEIRVPRIRWPIATASYFLSYSAHPSPGTRDG